MGFFCGIFFSEAENSLTHYSVRDQIFKRNGSIEEFNQFRNGFLAICAVEVARWSGGGR